MTPEALSIPIAPETGCCAETPATTEGVPLVSEQRVIADETCCQSSPASETISSLPVGETPAMNSHHESCSSHAVAVPAPSVEAASTDESIAPDDAALIDALREVIDPELMINIVDLGLVYSINQTDRKVLVEMTLTSPACPAGPQIISQAKMSLEKVSGVDAAEIKLTMSPPWTPDRMTDDARDQLGIF